jgi:hypothetical protein
MESIVGREILQIEREKVTVEWEFFITKSLTF